MEKLCIFAITKVHGQETWWLRVVSCLKNAQKLAYMHLQFQKYFRELYLRTPVKMGRVGSGGKWGLEGEEEKGLPRICSEGMGRRGGSCVSNDEIFVPLWASALRNCWEKIFFAYSPKLYRLYAL
jgi:hypothetical protein